MPVTVQTASPVDRSVDRPFKKRAVTGIRSTAQSTQKSREQNCYSQVDRAVDRQTCTRIRAPARTTVDLSGRPVNPDTDTVDCPVDRLRSKIKF